MPRLHTATMFGLILCSLALWSDRGWTQTASIITGGEVEVQLASGRRFRGEIDPRTDDTLLWIRFQRAGMVIARSIEWQQVNSVSQGEHVFSAEQVKPSRQSGRTALSPPISTPISKAAWQAGALSAAGNYEEVPTAEPANYLIPYSSFPAIVRQIHIDVQLGQWDADVEVDGLTVHLFALADDYSSLSVAGTLEATLLGRRLASRQHTEQFPEIGRWTLNVLPGDFGPAGAIYHLPFQATHPDFDFTLVGTGLLNAKLILPGQGTFEASADHLRIRPYSPLRDQLQMRQGTRFFSTERLGITH